MMLQAPPEHWSDHNASPWGCIWEIADGDMAVATAQYMVLDRPEGGTMKLWTPREHQIECKRLVELDMKVNAHIPDKLRSVRLSSGKLSAYAMRLKGIASRLAKLTAHIDFVECANEPADQDFIDWLLS